MFHHALNLRNFHHHPSNLAYLNGHTSFFNRLYSIYSTEDALFVVNLINVTSRKSIFHHPSPQFHPLFPFPSPFQFACELGCGSDVVISELFKAQLHERQPGILLIYSGKLFFSSLLCRFKWGGYQKSCSYAVRWNLDITLFVTFRTGGTYSTGLNYGI